MSVDLLAQGSTGAQRFSRNSGRSLTGDAVGAIRYPSPFFDIAHTYLPGSFKVMLRWCRYYFLTNPLINAVCYKMAEYPVTDLVFDSDRAPLRKRWDHFFKGVLNFKKFEVEAGLDYNCLAGETLVTTREGVFPIASLVDKTVEVLSEGGVYRPAKFSSFGTQDLYEVELRSGEVLFATADHEWPVIGPEGKVPTVELQGKNLVRTVTPDLDTSAEVVRIERSGRSEEVFCCVEPETHTFTVGNGVLTGNCYGNAFISISFPFQKLLRCKGCGRHTRVEHQKYVFRDHKFTGECKHCKHYGDFAVKDHYIRSLRDIRLVRWNPEYITVQYNEATGESRYYYAIPPSMANDIRMGKRHVIERIPQMFIEALRKNKAILFSRDNIYHMKRPTIAQKDRGWGLPMILPVLKDAFYLQVLRKAQECVAPSTYLETSHGLQQAKDVAVGDLVRTHTGRFLPVEDKWYRDAREEEVGVRVCLSGLRALPSAYSPNHPIFTIRRSEDSRRSDTKDVQRSSVILRNPHLYEEVVCPAKDLGVGQYVLYPRRLTTAPTTVDVAAVTGFSSTDGYVYSGCSGDTGQAFESLERGENPASGNSRKVAKRAIDAGRTPKRMERYLPVTKDLAYILGWYAGDGSCGARHIEISTHADDPIAALEESVRKVFGLACTHSESGKMRPTVFCDTIVTKLMKGLIPGRAREKLVPDVVLHGEDACKISFLKGLFAADGCVDPKRAVLSTSSVDLAYDVYRLGLHLGCIPTVSVVPPARSELEDGRIIQGGVSYHVTFCNASRDRLLSLWECGEGPEVTSGKSGFFWKDYFASRISSVEEVEEETYIDFKVKEDTTFCTPGSATKNSIAIEHVVPLRVLFPQSASGSADVYCVSHDTLVETREGVLPASEVSEGSFVKTHSGAWKRVEAHRDRPVGDSRVYEFKAAGITAFPLKVSHEHPLLVAKKTSRKCGYDNVGEPEWVEAEDVKEGDFVVYPTKTPRWSGTLHLDLHEYLPERACTEKYIYRKLNSECAEIYEFLEQGGVPDFQHDRGGRSSLLESRGWSLSGYSNARESYKTEGIDRIPRYLEVDEDLAFAIGVYAAEGHSAEGSPSFALHKGEKWVADELERIFKERGFIKKGSTDWRPVSENGAAFRVYDVLLGKFLSGVCGSGAQQKRLPRFIQEAPSSVAMAALKGLLLGDGHNFCTETRRLGLVTVSPNLAVQTRNMLLSEGFIPCVAKKVPGEEEISKLPSYRLDLNGAQADELARRFEWDRLGWTPGPDKIWSKCGFIRDGNVYLRVRSKTLVDSVETVRGFQVEGDKSFCVVGVATHNSTINLTQWRDKIEQEILRWRLDNNYIPILPVPVGQQTLGGDGRALMLAQEYRVWSEHIVAGMGVPTEFAFGGMSYSGSNVSMRILENHFLDQKAQRKQLIDDFILPNVGAYMGWDVIPCHYKRFKMADDLQRSALYLQINQAGKLSDKSLLEDLDWDSTKETNTIEVERNQVLEGQRRQAIAQANIQGEAQLAAMKYQMRGQKMMMEQAPPEAAAQGMPAQPPDPAAGVPGQMSPAATGGMQNAQMGMMNQTGQFPTMEVPPAAPGGAPQGGDPSQAPAQQGAAMQPAESPLQAGQQGAGYDIQVVAQQVVGWLDQLPEHERNHELINMQQQNPQLYSMVLQLLQARSGAEQNSAAAPLPEQRPPRRGPEAAMV